MNPKQKKFVRLGVGVMVLMGFMPPWTITLHLGDIDVHRPADYSFIFDPPKSVEIASVNIDFGRLLIQWAVVGFVIGAGIFYYRGTDTNPQSHNEINDT